MNKLKIKFVEKQNEMDQVINIRKTVFVKEQKVPVEIEIDGLDPESDHIIAFFNKQPVGCGRIRTTNHLAKFERIAVLKEHRGRGFGKQITNFMIKNCKTKNINEIIMHSQLHVADFYKKIGFKTRGTIFLEANIKHIKMYMKI